MRVTAIVVPDREINRVDALQVSRVKDLKQAWLGARLGDVSDELAREFQLPVNRGAYVLAVVVDRAAERPVRPREVDRGFLDSPASSGLT